MFESTAHFDQMFVVDLRSVSRFIYLSAPIHLFQNSLLRRMCFPIVLPLFLCEWNKPRLTKTLFMWTESWSLYSVSLKYFFIFAPIAL